ncbi:MAG TPA: SAM-dependent methyltransferase [Streptosporangiaceae bacterium]|nr:SAM-dependent methyltransferase [Streptosporangiaceae bacterium]
MTKPNIARVYDYLLGGKDNFAADREVAELTLRIMPDAREGPKSNRAFLRRAVRYLAAEAGIRQFIDIGSGLPTQGNVHEIAQAIDPETRVVYVDYDPVVLAHGRALLANDFTSVIMADLREPESILEHPALRRAIDFDRPVALLLLSILHHINDEDDPASIMATLRAAVPPGSHLAISHLHNPGSERPDDAELAKIGEEIFQKSYGVGRWRSVTEIRSFFGDWALLPPGLVPTSEWRPDPADDHAKYLTHYFVLGGVGKKA